MLVWPWILVVQLGQQHDGDAIGSDARLGLCISANGWMDTLVSASHQSKWMDGHTWTAISGEVVASRSLVTSRDHGWAAPYAANHQHSSPLTGVQGKACSVMNICRIYLATLSGTPPIAIAVPVILPPIATQSRTSHSTDIINKVFLVAGKNTLQRGECNPLTGPGNE